MLIFVYLKKTTTNSTTKRNHTQHIISARQYDCKRIKISTTHHAPHQLQKRVGDKVRRWRHQLERLPVGRSARHGTATGQGAKAQRAGHKSDDDDDGDGGDDANADAARADDREVSVP